MKILTINGYEIPSPSELSLELTDIDGNSQRNEAGFLNRIIIASDVRKFSVVWDGLNEGEKNELINITRAADGLEFFNMYFVDEYGEVDSSEFYRGPVSYTLTSVANGEKYYMVRFNIIERGRPYSYISPEFEGLAMAPMSRAAAIEEFTAASKDTVSQAFKTEILKSAQVRKIKINLNYKNEDGEDKNVTLTDDQVVHDSFILSSSCVPSSVFTVGGTISQDLSFEFYNPGQKYRNCKFKGKEATVYMGLDIKGTTEWCPLGTFIIDETGRKTGDTITINAADMLLLFEKSATEEVGKGKTTLGELFISLCSFCGCVGIAQFQNSNTTIKEINTTGMNCRELLGFIASAAGGFAKVSETGVVSIQSFRIDKNTNNEINKDITRVECVVDEAISIDSVAYTGEKENYLKGEGENPVIIDNNPVFDAVVDLDGLLDSILEYMDNIVYYPCELTYMGNPTMSPGDTVYLPETPEGDVYTFINNHKLRLTNSSNIVTDSCDELDRNFLERVKEESAAPGPSIDTGDDLLGTGENLLMKSLFTRAYHEGDYVKGCECLKIDNKAWNTEITQQFEKQHDSALNNAPGYYSFVLPCENLTKGQTYTLSFSLCVTSGVSANFDVIYMTNEAQLRTSKLYDGLLHVGSKNTNLKNPAWGTDKGEGLSWIGDFYKKTLGSFSLFEDSAFSWKWYSLTFTFEGESMISYTGAPVNMLLIECPNKNNHNIALQAAKLEVGDVATEWCPGRTENIQQVVQRDYDGFIACTMSSSVESSIFWPNQYVATVAPFKRDYFCPIRERGGNSLKYNYYMSYTDTSGAQIEERYNTINVEGVFSKSHTEIQRIGDKTTYSKIFTGYTTTGVPTVRRQGSNTYYIDATTGEMKHEKATSETIRTY